MSEFTPEHEAELAAMMSGQDGGMPYEKVLIESALGPYLTKIGMTIMQPYFDGKENADAVMEKIRQLDQPEPAPASLGDFARAYVEVVKEIAGKQFPDEPQFREDTKG